MFLVHVEILKISIIYIALEIVKIVKVSTAKIIKIWRVKGSLELGITIKLFAWETKGIASSRVMWPFYSYLWSFSNVIVKCICSSFLPLLLILTRKLCKDLLVFREESSRVLNGYLIISKSFLPKGQSDSTALFRDYSTIFRILYYPWTVQIDYRKKK